MSPIPASTLIPPAFANQGAPEWIWRPKDIEKGKSLRLYICSQESVGWMYYTDSKEIRLSQEFPTNFENDIGYKWGHGPGKRDNDGNPAEERSAPVKALLYRIWNTEASKMQAAVISSRPLIEQLFQIFSNTEFSLDDRIGYVANFYLQIFHNANPSSQSMTYTAQGHLRPGQNPAMFAAALEPWYPEQYWLGLNPFEAPVEPPANAGRPGNGAAPGTVLAALRDSNGADLEMGPAVAGEVGW